MTIDPPLALLAEVTYRCPLRCGYCSNPTDWGRFSPELDTETWRRVVREAADLGAHHLHLSGGEPLLRDDLEAIVAEARAAGLYVNLITSTWGLTEARVNRLCDAGVDHIQISFQDVIAARADALAGTAAHAQKLAAAKWVKSSGASLSVNVVLHRANLDYIGEIITMAESLGAERLELANTQYHGSALHNRATLMPSRAQLERASEIARREAARLCGTMDVLYILPDYFTDAPKPCMNGWGRRFMTVIPDGTALPCPGAQGLPGMAFENVRDRSVGDLWREGRDFQRYRGTAWMNALCGTCDQRDIDFGGCRCQAFALVGDATATDPTCSKSPHHTMITEARTLREESTLYRIDTSRPRRAR